MRRLGCRSARRRCRRLSRRPAPDGPLQLHHPGVHRQPGDGAMAFATPACTESCLGTCPPGSPSHPPPRIAWSHCHTEWPGTAPRGKAAGPRPRTELVKASAHPPPATDGRSVSPFDASVGLGAARSGRLPQAGSRRCPARSSAAGPADSFLILEASVPSLASRLLKALAASAACRALDRQSAWRQLTPSFHAPLAGLLLRSSSTERMASLAMVRVRVVGGRVCVCARRASRTIDICHQITSRILPLSHVASHISLNIVIVCERFLPLR